MFLEKQALIRLLKKTFVVTISLFLFSCTVQKRHYQKGYFFSWNNHTSKPSERIKETTQKQLPEYNTTAEIHQITALKTERLPSLSDPMASAETINQRRLPNADSCDVLVFRDGSETKVKIIEIGSAQIKYKKCDHIDGPLYVTNKTELFMITYANGTKEVIKTPETLRTQPDRFQNTNFRTPKKNTKLATFAIIAAALSFYPAVLVGGIAAIIAASIQLNRIALDPDMYGAERKAKLALVLGIVSVVIWLIIIAAILVL